MLLACVQTDVTFADVEANVLRIQGHLDAAAKRGADLVVFPECMLSGYAFDRLEDAERVAIVPDGPVIGDLAHLAKIHGLHFSVGYLERAGEQVFNASILLGPNGIVGQYRKIHLPHLGIDRFADPGDRPFAVYQAGDARVGMAICYDSSFPESIRELGLQGADVVALGTNWPSAAVHTAHLVPPARSMENHLFFAAANRIGHENGFSFCGLSSICGPDGVELARAEGDEEVILYAEIDVWAARNKRIERTKDTHVIDRFDDRRPEFYRTLVADPKTLPYANQARKPESDPPE
ncbi:MAG: carbon-nitrogen hydrolase family protein [Planctomycetota bacterium]